MEQVSSLSRVHWEIKAHRRLGLPAGTELSLPQKLLRNLRITEAYAELYLRNPHLYKWAGMAALTSATVGKGMYAMLLLKYTGMGGVVGLFGRDVNAILEQLVAGNLLVFTDIYWQHLAYEQGGLKALAAVYEAGKLECDVFRAWELIDTGRRCADMAQIWEGNAILLKFEQQRVLQPGVYDDNLALWQEVAGWIPSPIPGQFETFADFLARGNIGVFEERWRWIEGRMLPRWKQLSDHSAESVQRALMSSVQLATWCSLLEAQPDSIGRGMFRWLRMVLSVSALT